VNWSLLKKKGSFYETSYTFQTVERPTLIPLSTTVGRVNYSDVRLVTLKCTHEVLEIARYTTADVELKMDSTRSDRGMKSTNNKYLHACLSNRVSVGSRHGRCLSSLRRRRANILRTKAQLTNLTLNKALPTTRNRLWYDWLAWW